MLRAEQLAQTPRNFKNRKAISSQANPTGLEGSETTGGV